MFSFTSQTEICTRGKITVIVRIGTGRRRCDGGGQTEILIIPVAIGSIARRVVVERRIAGVGLVRR